MAETIASAVVNIIFEKLTDDEALKKFARSQKIHSELDELQTTLSQVKALLNDASHKEITQEAVGLWLNSLQHLAYDIDDLLDDVATQAMHRELTQESGAVTSKVRNLIVPTCCTNLSLDNRLRRKLDSITNKLQNLENQKGDLGLVEKDEKKKNIHRGNESSLLEPDVVGREVEKEKLINSLLGGESSKENFSIVPIVGMGGVGKTTMARLVYNDTKVMGHFELKTWVCVSDDFDTFKISDIILHSLTRENKKFKDLNQLQTALTQAFKDKRFLLVVDDVWSESYDDWEILVRPFRSCAPGSMIIMTTRKEQLLKTLGFHHLDHLESLSERDALSLFSLHALGVDNFDLHPTLRPKGEAIVGKCGCLPLALKAIGRLLRTKTDEEDWDDVLNSEIWDLGNCNEIVPALRLSYHDLSAHLKQLFTYCSLFPKDFLFDKKELILLWMAEGYLNQPSTNKSPERLGEEYFEKLFLRSFFQYAPNDKSFFVMHDLMNDFATFVAGEYFLRFEKQAEMADEALAKYRHMSFIHEDYVSYQKLKAFERAKSLRTFLAVPVGVKSSWNTYYLSNKILLDVLPELLLLRVLSLRGFKIKEVPKFIGSLKHLRYLNLSQTDIKELPESVGNLYNLQTLIIFGCRSLTKLPKTFLKLKMLRHLDMRGTPDLKKLPLGIGKLTNLQTLTKITIGGEVGFAVTELKGLPNLHGKISIEGLCNVQSAMHAREANLSLKKLTSLELKWGDGSQRSTLEKEVLNELKPHTDTLKYISFDYYEGIEFPGWVGDPSLHQLVCVSINNCGKCTSLPPLGQLPSLKQLFIQGIDEVKVIGSEFIGASNVVAFSSLEILTFDDMLGWEEWSTNSVVLDAVFPCLQEIHIRNCPNLRKVSLAALPSLKVLKIGGCSDDVLRNLLHSASSIMELDISSISGLTDEVWRAAIKYLGKVEELNIQGCDEIRYLWESEAEAGMVFVNLKKLSVSDCKNMVRLGEKEEKEDFGSNLLSSLKSLIVYYCASMERVCCPNSNSIESLKIVYCSSLTHVSFPTTKEEGGQKLKSLDIIDCGELTEKINNTNMPMVESVGIKGWRNLKSIIQLSNFIHTTHLIIRNCPSIESFSNLELSNLTRLELRNCGKVESLPELSNLTFLEITDWKRVESLPDLSNLTFLKELIIRVCPSMNYPVPVYGVWPPNLSRLVIGRLKRPISEWGLQNFPASLVGLTLLGEEDVMNSNLSQFSHIFPSSLTQLSIVGFNNLESLSAGIQHLTSLQHLEIEFCPKMKHLPEMLLPSLLSLQIIYCTKLKERCNGRGSHYWPLISHIPRIYL
ncbi:hypothetical protein SSX86_012371 [Deinandra increscens subsp. villosa]|uniref:NB-ARC n=1 Tax=Deinandra increscens subsp. villosa TaxID=3103831 RepID=A0AAP0D458_9ASTR